AALLDVLQEALHGLARGAEALAQDAAALAPGGHEDEDARRDHQGEPASLEDLDEVGGEEGEVDDEEDAHQGLDEDRVPAPALARDDGEEDRRDEHGGGDGDAVGGG